jgi:hypothetical protein
MLMSMGRACSICARADRHELEADHKRGILSLRKLAAKYDTSVPTIVRHLRNCSNVPPVPDAPDDTFTKTLPVTTGSFNAYERILIVQAEFEELLQAAKDAGNDMMRMMALGEIRKTVESMVKIFEAQQKVALMYHKEDVSASLVYRWLAENYPDVLEGLKEYTGRHLV